jgi:hypothetical protein
MAPAPEILTPDLVRMRNLVDMARRLSEVRSRHALGDPKGCPICAAVEEGYRDAVKAYTDPFGVRS